MPKKIALVIGSGSVKCAAALGVWKALKQAGLNLDRVVGCSGGSIYAAVIALGYEVEEATHLTQSLWTEDLVANYPSSLKAVMSGEQEFNERSGIVDGGPLMERLTSTFGERTFAETKLPLHVVATDLRNGERVVLSQGRVVDAVRASVAIPLIFPPWEVDGRLLVDGAVSDPLPVDVAIKEGGDVILSLGFDLPYRNRLRSFNAVQAQLNAIYVNNILRATYSFYNVAHHAEIVALWPDFDKPIANFDTHQFPYIIERGEQALQAHLPYLKQLLQGEGPG
jgi:NTE family protein